MEGQGGGEDGLVREVMRCECRVARKARHVAEIEGTVRWRQT